MLEITNNKDNSDGVVVVRNSKPVGVYVPFHKWEEIQTLIANNNSQNKEVDVDNFWVAAKQKLAGKGKSKVLTQEEIDKLSYEG